MTHRMNKLRQLRWVSGAIIPESAVQQDLLSQEEKEYFNAYSKILGDYSDAIGVDLTASIEVQYAILPYPTGLIIDCTVHCSRPRTSTSWCAC